MKEITFRSEAVSILPPRIESVTICSDEPGRPEAEVVAKVSNLLAWATNDNAAHEGGVMSVSVMLVAGTGFEPVTFRL